MRGPRNLLWQLPLALVVAAPLWWGGLTGFLAPPTDTAPGRTDGGKRLESFVMDGVRFSQYQGGVEEWTISSRHMASSHGGDVLLLDGVDADLLRDGAPFFHIVGKAGRYDQKKRELGVAGAVTVRHRRGGVLSTEQLYYLDRRREIYSPATVRMEANGMEVRGKGFVYDLDHDSYRLDGRVTVDVD